MVRSFGLGIPGLRNAYIGMSVENTGNKNVNITSSRNSQPKRTLHNNAPLAEINLIYGWLLVWIADILKNLFLSWSGLVVVVVAPLPASTGGWAAERAPGYFPPGTLCGVCVDLDERRVPQEGNAVLMVRPQLVQWVYVVWSPV